MALLVSYTTLEIIYTIHTFSQIPYPYYLICVKDVES